MTILKSLLVIAAAGLMSSAALAGDNGSTLGKQLVQPSVQVKIKKEVFVQGNAESASLSAGYNNVDTGSTLTCAKTCTITLTAQVQYEPGAVGTEWAIAQLVDGSIVASQYQNEASNTFFQSGSAQTAAVNLAAGSHTVQTQIYVSGSSTLQYYSMTYAVNQ